MSSTAYTLGLMFGLAVGIDYSLFILEPLPNEPAGRHAEGPGDIALANGTSGNAVTFAASTVIIALVALNVTGIPSWA